jgi:hypothetical protein
MADVASKQQMTALFLCTTTHAQDKKLAILLETCAVPENIQLDFSCSFLCS